MPTNVNKRKSSNNTNVRNSKQEGGSFNASNKAAYIPPINRTLRGETNSNYNIRIMKNKSEKMLEMTDYIYNKGFIIADPSLMRFETTEKKINSIKEILNNLKIINKQLTDIMKDGENYIKGRNKKLTDLGIPIAKTKLFGQSALYAKKNEYIYWKNWRDKKLEERNKKSSARKAKNTSSKGSSARRTKNTSSSARRMKNKSSRK